VKERGGGCPNLRVEDLGAEGWAERRKVDLVGTEQAIRRMEGPRCGVGQGGRLDNGETHRGE
jgi:hypothetical protein